MIIMNTTLIIMIPSGLGAHLFNTTRLLIFQKCSTRHNYLDATTIRVMRVPIELALALTESRCHIFQMRFSMEWCGILSTIVRCPANNCTYYLAWTWLGFQKKNHLLPEASQSAIGL